MVKLRLGAGATIVLLSIAVSVAGPVQATAPMGDIDLCGSISIDTNP